MTKLTTIQLRKSTMERLKEFKTHPRQSYDEAINELMTDNEIEVLTMDEIAELKESLEEVKEGKLISMEDIAKKYGVGLVQNPVRSKSR